MNPPIANLNANSKFLQATVALKNGLTIPPSFYGSSPALASSFLDSISQNKDVSIKPLESIHLKSSDGNTYAHYNTIFRRRGQEELYSLRQCPVILQEFIKKKLEVRATLVGKAVYATSIDTSLASEAAKVDWRHYDWANTPYRVFHLSGELENKLIGIANDLQIQYGAFDLILGADGDIYFLEVNPQGQWLWVEDLTDLPISAAVASWLYTNSKVP